MPRQEEADDENPDRHVDAAGPRPGLRRESLFNGKTHDAEYSFMMLEERQPPPPAAPHAAAARAAAAMPSR